VSNASERLQEAVAGEFPFYEVRIADVLGLSREVLMLFRREHLARMEDWTKDGNHVVYTWGACGQALEFFTGTASQLTDIAALERLAAIPPVALLQKKTAPRLSKEVVTMKVAELYRNKRIIGARADGEVVRVRVRSSKNFVIGMEIPVVQVEENLWDLARACPRRRGKW